VLIAAWFFRNYILGVLTFVFSEGFVVPILRVDASDAFMTITRIDNFVVGCQGSGAIENNAHPTQACALGCSPPPPIFNVEVGRPRRAKRK